MNLKKLFALLLAVVMVLSMAACNKAPADTTAGTKAPADTTEAPADTTAAAETPVEYVDPYADLREDHDALSEAIYMDVLGEFLEYFEAAKAATSISERYQRR